MFATLDLMTAGRAAWNVVTSLNDGEALNMGRAAAPAHDERYDRADEFMEIVLGHWQSWADDALIVDKASGRFADASKVARLDYAGSFCGRAGHSRCPELRKGRPVVIQAGSERTRSALRRSLGGGRLYVCADARYSQAGYAAVRGEIAAAGRDPDNVKVCNLVMPVARRVARRSRGQDGRSVATPARDRPVVATF